MRRDLRLERRVDAGPTAESDAPAVNAAPAQPAGVHAVIARSRDSGKVLASWRLGVRRRPVAARSAPVARALGSAARRLAARSTTARLRRRRRAGEPPGAWPAPRARRGCRPPGDRAQPATSPVAWGSAARRARKSAGAAAGRRRFLELGGRSQQLVAIVNRADLENQASRSRRKTRCAGGALLLRRLHHPLAWPAAVQPGPSDPGGSSDRDRAARGQVEAAPHRRRSGGHRDQHRGRAERSPQRPTPSRPRRRRAFRPGTRSRG